MTPELKIRLIEINPETGDIRLELQRTVGPHKLGVESLAVDALDDFDARLEAVEANLSKEGFPGVNRAKLSRALAIRNTILADDDVKAFNTDRRAKREAEAKAMQALVDAADREKRGKD